MAVTEGPGTLLAPETARRPRVRQAFTKLGIIEFEDFDPTEQDRKLGLA